MKKETTRTVLERILDKMHEAGVQVSGCTDDLHPSVRLIMEEIWRAGGLQDRVILTGKTVQ
jgi:hypothetical protein